MESPSTSLWRPELQAMVDGLGGDEPEWGDGTVDYVLDELTHEVDVMYGGQRVRVVVYIDRLDDPLVSEAAAWAEAQGAWSPALLEVWKDEPTDFTYLTATFERPLIGHDWSQDPLERHSAEIWHAWGDRRTIVTTPDVVRFGDPTVADPQSAWLLVGSSASLITDDELDLARRHNRLGMYDHLWTAAKQTKAGDLLLIYCTAPDKAVRFVARAASDAFFSRDIPVNADDPVADEQWWVPMTPPVEIEPVTFGDLQAASDGHLILRGRSGHFLHPDVISRLRFAPREPSSATDLVRIVRPPTGLADLPTPQNITLVQWRDIAPGALRLEKDVSTYLVEPLLRLLGLELWQRERPAGRRYVDYAVLGSDDVPSSVIEVKLAANPAKDLLQVQDYMKTLGCNGILFDALRLRLVHADHSRDVVTIDRKTLTTDDLAVVARHLGQTRLDARGRPNTSA